MNESLWNIFDEQRPLLNHQYQDTEFRLETGFDIGILQVAADNLISGSHDLPLIQPRSRLLELVMAHGRIHLAANLPVRLLPYPPCADENTIPSAGKPPCLMWPSPKSSR